MRWMSQAGPAIALGFGQRDVKTFLAGPRFLHQEVRGRDQP